MEQRRLSREVLRSLALGLHPISGEPLQKSSIFDEALVIRALILAVEALQDPEPAVKRVSRERPPRAGQPWTLDEDEELRKEFADRVPLHQVVTAHERRTSSILARLVRLKLAESRTDAPRILARKSNRSVNKQVPNPGETA